MLRWDATRVAVTGASGFVGRALVAALRSRSATVVGLSRTERERGERLAWVAGDLRDRDAVAELVDGAEVVFHAASFVHRRPRSRADLEELHAINVGGTTALVDAVVARPTPPILIFVSSTAVYGTVPGPWDETSDCRPTTAYGRSKLEAERVVLERCARAAVVRASAIVGEGAPGSLETLDRWVRRGIVPVIGGGGARKSFTHVSTVVAACLRLAEGVARGGPVARTIVVTDDQACTVADVARWRASAAGRTIRLVSIPRPVATVVAGVAGALRLGRVADLIATAADDAVATSTTMRALGVEPERTAASWLSGARR